MIFMVWALGLVLFILTSSLLLKKLFKKADEYLELPVLFWILASVTIVLVTLQIGSIYGFINL